MKKIKKPTHMLNGSVILSNGMVSPVSVFGTKEEVEQHRQRIIKQIKDGYYRGWIPWGDIKEDKTDDREL